MNFDDLSLSKMLEFRFAGREKEFDVEKDIQTILTRELLVLNYLKIRQTDGDKALKAMGLQGMKL